MSSCHKIISQKRVLQSIMRITQTMKTVALAKVTYGQQGLKNLRYFSQYWNRMVQCIKSDTLLQSLWGDFFKKYPYLQAIANLIEENPMNLKQEKRDPMFGIEARILKYPEQKNHHIYVIGSDHGFCGGLLTQLGLKTQEWIAFLENSGKTVNLSFIGKKTLAVFTRRFSSEKTAFLWQGLDKNRLSNPTVKMFILDVLKRAESGEILWVIYPKFKSILSQEIVCDLLSPWGIFEKKNDQDDILKKNTPLSSKNTPLEHAVSTDPSHLVFEHSEVVLKGKSQNTIDPLHYGYMSYDPTPEEAILSCLRTKLSLQIRYIIWEAFTSEQASRFLNMRNASQNAERMIKSLGQEYNRARQTKITVELIEVVAGAKS
jgi:ATP synthase F1 gamma subunit